MKNPFSRISLLFVMAILLILSGCGRSSPTRYYVLSELRDAGNPATLSGNVRSITIGVGPVTIPDYLNRRHIVSRSGQNRLNVAGFDVWGGSLQENVASVIAENLSLLIPSVHVYEYPWTPNIPLDYTVTVDITRLDGVLGGDAVLNARWMVTGDDWRKILGKSSSLYTEPTGGDGYTDLVAAESRLLGKLSRDIAASIRAISAAQPASQKK